jgi:hypothetical protein
LKTKLCVSARAFLPFEHVGSSQLPSKYVEPAGNIWCASSSVILECLCSHKCVASDLEQPIRVGAALVDDVTPDRHDVPAVDACCEGVGDLLAAQQVVDALLRLRNGVLHNPKSDRRTTAGIFHVTEGGLPIPDDKKAVPREVFAALLRRALQPPEDLQRLPFTAGTVPAECFVSMQIRPVVAPEVPGFHPQKSMEIRFLVPGSLVANLDFIESIFGNGGDP